MPSAKKWGSCSIFHLRKAPTLEQIDELPKWAYPGKGKTTIGIVPIFRQQYAVPLENSGVWFRLRISGPVLVPSEKKYQVDTRIAKAVEKQLALTKDEINKITDEEVEKLKKKTPPTHKQIDVMFRDDWFIVCEGAANKSDAVTSFLLDKLSGEFSVKKPEIAGDLTGLGIELFKSEQLDVDNITLGSGVKVKMEDDTVVQVTKAQYPKVLLSTLKKCKEVMTMCVEWDKFGGSIRRDLSFTGVFDGFDPTEIEGEYPDDERQFIESQARAVAFIKNMPLMLKDVAIHCGDLMPLPEEPEDNVVPIKGKQS